MAITATLSAWGGPCSGSATEAKAFTGTGTARELAERWGAELRVDPELAWAARMRARLSLIHI